MQHDHLNALESESIFIMREAFAKFDNLAMLWSIGKDSTALLWLARKAFFGHVPFPLVHIDTSYKIPSMIEYRDRLVREWNLQLVVGMNKPGNGPRSVPVAQINDPLSTMGDPTGFPRLIAFELRLGPPRRDGTR